MTPDGAAAAVRGRRRQALGDGDRARHPVTLHAVLTYPRPLVVVSIAWSGSWLAYEALPAHESALVEKVAITPSAGSWARFWSALALIREAGWGAVPPVRVSPSVGDWWIEADDGMRGLVTSGLMGCPQFHALEGALAALLGRPVRPSLLVMRGGGVNAGW